MNALRCKSEETCISTLYKLPRMDTRVAVNRLLYRNFIISFLLSPLGWYVNKRVMATLAVAAVLVTP